MTERGWTKEFATSVGALGARRRQLIDKADTFELFRAHELVALHGYRDFIMGGLGPRQHTPQHFSEAPDSYRRIAARERNQILDATPNLDVGWRKEANAARTDVARLFSPVHAFIAQLDNLER